MSRARNLLLLAVLAICAVSFWWARRSTTPEAAAPAVAPIVDAEVPAAMPPTVHVAVLNGTREAGLARRFSRALAEYGCVVVETADAPHDTFSRSLLINRRLSDAQAAQLARTLGAGRVLREWDPRRREDVVVVLGRDHARLLRSRDR